MKPRPSTWWRRAAHAVVAWIAVAVIRVLWASYRFRIDDDATIRRMIGDGKPLILTFWHEHIFVMARYLGALGRLGARVTYLVSPSRDGDLGVQILDLMGAESVRGSATRSGVKAMRGLYRAIVRDNGCPVVLPDGPTGPRRHCKPGSILLAQLSGAHVVPMACQAGIAWRLRTWDRLLVPAPFSRVRIMVGAPYTVPKTMDASGLEKRRLDLQWRLEDLCRHIEGEDPSTGRV